jgi:hypothetical protein
MTEYTYCVLILVQAMPKFAQKKKKKLVIIT